jgi:hypothetical protein
VRHDVCIHLTRGVRMPDWGEDEYRIYGWEQECLLSMRVSVQHNMESKRRMHAQRNRTRLSIRRDASTALWRYCPTLLLDARTVVSSLLILELLPTACPPPEHAVPRDLISSLSSAASPQPPPAHGSLCIGQTPRWQRRRMNVGLGRALVNMSTTLSHERTYWNATSPFSVRSWMKW